MAHTPKISIIIPVYNAEKFLHRCIESILTQTFSDFELLLIDDGSKDSSGFICDEYAKKDSRIWVIHQRNAGVSAARNIGLDKAQGEWITFCDADDWTEKGWLETTYKIFSQNDIDIIRFGYKIDDNGKTELIQHNAVEILSDYSAIWDKCYKNRYSGYLWNSVFKRKTIGNIKFDETLHLCEDHIFTNKVVLQASKVYLSQDCFYHYKINQSISLSNVSNPYYIYNAGIKAFEVDTLFTKKVDILYKKALSIYHGNMSGAIATAYKFCNRNERKSFAKQFVIMTSKDITFTELLFNSKHIPFFLKDLLFILKYNIFG